MGASSGQAYNGDRGEAKAGNDLRTCPRLFFVLRAYSGAPVATPLEWSEVRHGLYPAQFHIANARQRFAEKGDLFAGVLEKPQRLEGALGQLEKLLRG